MNAEELDSLLFRAQFTLGEVAELLRRLVEENRRRDPKTRIRVEDAAHIEMLLCLVDEAADRVTASLRSSRDQARRQARKLKAARDREAKP